MRLEAPVLSLPSLMNSRLFELPYRLLWVVSKMLRGTSQGERGPYFGNDALIIEAHYEPWRQVRLLIKTCVYPGSPAAIIEFFYSFLVHAPSTALLIITHLQNLYFQRNLNPKGPHLSSPVSAEGWGTSFLTQKSSAPWSWLLGTTTTWQIKNTYY